MCFQIVPLYTIRAVAKSTIDTIGDIEFDPNASTQMSQQHRPGTNTGIPLYIIAISVPYVTLTIPIVIMTIRFVTATDGNNPACRKTQCGGGAPLVSNLSVMVINCMEPNKSVNIATPHIVHIERPQQRVSKAVAFLANMFDLCCKTLARVREFLLVYQHPPSQLVRSLQCGCRDCGVTSVDITTYNV